MRIARLNIIFMLPAILLLVLESSVLAQEPIDFRYSYDDLGQLVKVIDSEGNVVEYVYDEVGNMLEIKRSSIAGLPAIFRFEPAQGPSGTVVSIEGQEFSSTPEDNVVTFNGVQAQMLSATPDTLEVIVPEGASSGPITVAVGGETATSSDSFIVLNLPSISSINPPFTAPGQIIIDVLIGGNNLNGSEFSFLPIAESDKLKIESVSIDQTGLEAHFNLMVDANTFPGEYVLVASNAAGSSANEPSEGNTFVVLDPSGDPDEDTLTNQDEGLLYRTNPLDWDTDDDEYHDGIEVASGSDPLDSESIPQAKYEASQLISLLNSDQPPYPENAASQVTSLLNTAQPAYPTYAASQVISLLNSHQPPHATYAASQVVSVRNEFTAP